MESCLSEMLTHSLFGEQFCCDGTTDTGQGTHAVRQPHEDARIARRDIQMIHVETCRIKRERAVNRDT